MWISSDIAAVTTARSTLIDKRLALRATPNRADYSRKPATSYMP